MWPHSAKARWIRTDCRGGSTWRGIGLIGFVRIVSGIALPLLIGVRRLSWLDDRRLDGRLQEWRLVVSGLGRAVRKLLVKNSHAKDLFVQDLLVKSLLVRSLYVRNLRGSNLHIMNLLVRNHLQNFLITGLSVQDLPV